MVKSEKLYRQIADDIGASIKRGAYPVGSRLPVERELSETYGVSRATIREALIALEMQDLVASRKGSGIYVIGIPGEAQPELDVGAFELAEARRQIEGESAALAATMIDDEILAELEELVTVMLDPDEAKAVAADREFHLTIARATGNGAFVATVTLLWDIRDSSPLAHRIYSHADHHTFEPRAEEHRRIVNALRSGSPDAARTAMREHLDKVIDHLLETTEIAAIEQARKDAEARRRRMARRFA